MGSVVLLVLDRPVFSTPWLLNDLASLGQGRVSSSGLLEFEPGDVVEPGAQFACLPETDGPRPRRTCRIECSSMSHTQPLSSFLAPVESPTKENIQSQLRHTLENRARSHRKGCFPLSLSPSLTPPSVYS